ncbi:MAG TPA: hypothetical protein VIL08_03185 [Limnochorda sp.]
MDEKRMGMFLDSMSYMESAAREVMGEIQRHIEAMAKLNALLAYYVAALRIAIDHVKLMDRGSEKAYAETEGQP